MMARDSATGATWEIPEGETREVVIAAEYKHQGEPGFVFVDGSSTGYFGYAEHCVGYAAGDFVLIAIRDDRWQVERPLTEDECELMMLALNLSQQNGPAHSCPTIGIEAGGVMEGAQS